LKVFNLRFILKIFLICICMMLLMPVNILSHNYDEPADTSRTVHFFGPSTTEMDTLNEDDASALDDFNYYTSRVVPFIRQNNLKIKYLSGRIIEIPYDSKKLFIVYRDSVEFGTILADGVNTPEILEYVLTDDELKEEIKAYFKVK